MPRTARIKSTTLPYHIIIRSISEVDLFKESIDKEVFLNILKKYKELYLFEVYAYCLMDNHAHFIINPNGADISKIMKSINQSYTAYFNKKYNRHGHLFQDRFKSILIYSDRQLAATSAYIHNNPKSIPQFSKKVHMYKYSSLSILINKNTDTRNILNMKTILNLFSDNLKSAISKYIEYVMSLYTKSFKDLLNDFKNTTEEDANIESLTISLDSETKPLTRNITLSQVIEYVSLYYSKNLNIHLKYNHETSQFKSLCVVLLRCFGNYNLNKISELYINLTPSAVSSLFKKAVTLLNNDINFYKFIENFTSYIY